MRNFFRLKINLFLLIFAIAATATFAKIKTNDVTSGNKKKQDAQTLSQNNKVNKNLQPGIIAQEYYDKITHQNGDRKNKTEAFQKTRLSGPGDFGWSISSAGDLNGDGYDDIIIGDDFKDAAYIFFGGPHMSNIPNVKLSDNNGSSFGYSVSGAGDVNGDGYSDVIVGAPSSGQYYVTGKDYIYFGGPNMDNNPDVILNSTSGELGNSVACAGDVNGDGYSDVMASCGSEVLIYYGGSSMDSIANVTLQQPGSSFLGASIADAGDVNGDGYSDVIVGSYGKAYVYYGGSPMDSTAGKILIGDAQSSSYFGEHVCGAGDLNGDGYSDLVVSDVTNNDIYIYFGGPAIDSTADLKITAPPTSAEFGKSIAINGDVNGDGFDDLLVGASANGYGRIYVYYGGMHMDTTADIVINNDLSYGLESVVYAGDLNKNGYTDIIASEQSNYSVGEYGNVFIFTHSLKGMDTPEYTLSPLGASYKGFTLSSAGDVNGDGYDDILIGDPYYNSNTGRVYLYFGGPNITDTANVVFTGRNTGDNFGCSISSAGVNGNGYSDFIIGADGYHADTGIVYIYFGASSPNLFGRDSLKGYGKDSFGCSVADAGDVNGDGVSDFIVGAIGYKSGTGRAYVYFGDSYNYGGVDTLTGETPNSYFGTSVASAGDVNGDGYSDIIVGADGYNSFTGQAYIYFGGNTLDTAASVILNPGSANNAFGVSVSSAGDVNEDGYSDVIVGADRYNSFTGRAYVYFGGKRMNYNDNYANLTLEGEHKGDYFGHVVSTAGDVNGDGYSDIIITADKHNISDGKAYIYFGGNLMDNIEDITMKSESGGGYFGGSAALAGDVNHDGLSDLIVSSNYRIYLYESTAPPVKPNIYSVKDVSNDQGGYVGIKWSRSSFDIKTINSIKQYIVQMSFPPGNIGFAWENIAEVTPTHDPYYLYTAKTPYDSIKNSSGTFYFRIIAQDKNGIDLWKSNIRSGHSVDNLAPAAPQYFKISPSGNSAVLTWAPNTEKDLKDYTLYRSTTSTINPDTTTPLVVTMDTLYTDNSPLSGSSYYFIRASDVHGNYSTLTSASNNPLPVELTTFTATAKGRDIYLQWETGSELNISQFVVQRKLSNSKADWNDVSSVASESNSTSPRKYQFADRNLIQGKYSYRLKIVGSSGEAKYSQVVNAVIGLPDKFSVSQNYPNPFNPTTSINYSLPQAGFVNLTVYNILGKKVITLVNGKKAPGYHTVIFNGSSFASGVYIYSLRVQNKFSAVKKMVIMK